jgi:hypothetical protein
LRVCSGPSAVCGTGDDLQAIARSAATAPVLVLPHTAAVAHAPGSVLLVPRSG